MAMLKRRRYPRNAEMEPEQNEDHDGRAAKEVIAVAFFSTPRGLEGQDESAKELAGDSEAALTAQFSMPIVAAYHP